MVRITFDFGAEINYQIASIDRELPCVPRAGEDVGFEFGDIKMKDGTDYDGDTWFRVKEVSYNLKSKSEVIVIVSLELL